MADSFRKKRLLAVVVLVALLAVLYAGFRYRQYTNAPGRVRTFTGKVTYIPEIDTVCKFIEINKNTLVRVSCDKAQSELNAIQFQGQYDTDIKQGDTVEVKAVRFDPQGASKYKWYEIRATGTYVKRVQ